MFQLGFVMLLGENEGATLGSGGLARCWSPFSSHDPAWRGGSSWHLLLYPRSYLYIPYIFKNIYEDIGNKNWNTEWSNAYKLSFQHLHFQSWCPCLNDSCEKLSSAWIYGLVSHLPVFSPLSPIHILLRVIPRWIKPRKVSLWSIGLTALCSPANAHFLCPLLALAANAVT